MSAKPLWPYIHQTLEIGGVLNITTQGRHLTVSSLECDGQMVCMISSGGMSLDEIMDVYWASLGSIRKGQLTLVFPLETLHDLSYRRMAGGSLA